MALAVASEAMEVETAVERAGRAAWATVAGATAAAEDSSSIRRIERGIYQPIGVSDLR